VPAGSLPNNERILAGYGGYANDPDGWARVRESALHGFVECSDGRLYHPVVCQEAERAGSKRAEWQAKAARMREGKAKKHGSQNGTHVSSRSNDESHFGTYVSNRSEHGSQNGTHDALSKALTKDLTRALPYKDKDKENKNNNNESPRLEPARAKSSSFG
jgi:hypothetical protein